MASFSDRALLGSQEGWVLSVGKSDKLAEGATNLQLTVPGQSNNMSKLIYNKKFVPFAEESVRCPLRINAVVHEVGHDENRIRSLDAVESAQQMYHEGKKRHRQIAENVSVVQDMLECSIEKRFGETGLPSINHDNQKIKNAVSQEELAMQHLTMSDEPETHSHPTDSRPMSDVTGITHVCNEEIGDASRNYLGSFDEVEDGDYLKLLSLDNPLDEEIYRVAIERPLSPTLPEIGPLSGSKSQPACSPRYYVIFSDLSSNKSVTKILSATRTCMARCSMPPQTDHVVQVMSTLLKVEGLLSREMVCVFFSLLLQNVPEFTLENFKNLTDGGLVHSVKLFAEHVRAVMDDLETRSIEELLNLDELLSLIEDFLIHRRVLLHRDVLSESLPLYDPKSNIISSGGDMLSFQAASDQQLISASVVLTSICLAVDHIGFVCETSYNLLKMRKIDSSTLAILHVFAFISGAKYFTNCDHSLSMIVLKSLITFFEREMSSTSVVQFGFPACKNCPYAVSAIPMDDVVSLLIEKLHNYVLSNVSFEDLKEATVYMNDKVVTCGTLCETLLYLGDVLSLLELLASNMNWSWSFKNIVVKLLDILDSCGIEKLVPAIVVLLGQLGRIGVDANGYDDSGVETLRGRLSSFLHRKASAVTELPFQIATVTALLGVVPLRFEELFKSNNELSEVVKDSGPADCADFIRHWFSLLR
ncbi:hypothetical protein POM88_035228 [Heracleum sosnowskyi]|uniref:Uncharacterized protein n=1 Tax=Heracleum sosnowskyi TaxID=360622 RepID=A0AAD8MD18_9APIA|nr:hypothetical protein POM88_035228 [Heracleum sosnowskyi]